MEKEFGTFRKATFGGFNRKDVINYIERMKNETFEYKSQVEETVRNLNDKISELERAARQMQTGVAETDNLSKNKAFSVPENSIGDIKDSTKHLKVVADELCRSLGEFIEKLSQKGLYEDANSVPQLFKDEETSEENNGQNEIDRILSSLTFLNGGASGNSSVMKKEGGHQGVEEILNGLSFLK